MSHSHLPIKHLLRRIETMPLRPRRDVRPEWVTQLIGEVAELFEPFTDIGRVGYDCRVTDDRWEVGMYLGTTELVGGKADGDVQHVDFQFDLMRLYRLFSQIDLLQWNAFPQSPSADSEFECSFIALEGKFNQNPLRLRVFCTPPTEAGPGLRHHTDGTWETV